MRPIPAHNVPFIDPATGLVDRLWYEFLKGATNISLGELQDYEAPASLSDQLDTAFGSTRGSLLCRGASGWQLVSPASNGYVLTDNGSGADPAFEALTPAGAWTHIGTYTPSSVAQLDITGLGSYKSLRLTFDNWMPATDNVELKLRLSSDNGSTFLSTNYISPVGGTTDCALIVTAGQGNASTDGGAKGVVHIHDFAPAQKTFINCSYNFMYFNTSGSQQLIASGANYHTNQTAMNAIRLYYASGNIASGTLVLEGL